MNTLSVLISNPIYFLQTLFVFELLLGISDTFLYFTSIHPSKSVPSPGVQMRQTVCVVNLVS